MVATTPLGPTITAVIQARFGSRRFPGKVLATFRGRAVLAHVLEVAASACGKDSVILATSDRCEDDPVADFGIRDGWRVYRGNLEDVWSRFQAVVRQRDLEWIIRICADSPLLPVPLIVKMKTLVCSAYDLVTNVHPRTFPHGQSIEILHRRLFLEERFFPPTPLDREHVTSHLYRIPEIRILNYENPFGDHSSWGWSVEEPGDIARLEKLCAA